MKENSAAAGILASTIEKVRDLVDTSTIIGEPIYAEGGMTIIPVTKVTYGLATGGSDFPPSPIRRFLAAAAESVSRSLQSRSS